MCILDCRVYSEGDSKVKARVDSGVEVLQSFFICHDKEVNICFILLWIFFVCVEDFKQLTLSPHIRHVYETTLLILGVMTLTYK